MVGGWSPIATAPKDGTKLLLSHTATPEMAYVGAYRYGNLGEPQQGECAWRASCCGKFAHPDRWASLPT